MKAIFKIAMVFVGIAALSLVEIGLMFWFGSRDVNNFCDEATPGLSISQLSDLAKKHDVRLTLPGMHESSGTYLAFAQTPRSFGRHTCMIQHDNIAVIQSRYRYAD